MTATISVFLGFDMIMINRFLFYESMPVNAWKQSCELYFDWDQNRLFKSLYLEKGFELFSKRLLKDP